MAGLENQRLYFDQFYKFFIFKTNEISTSFIPMNLRLVLNGRTNSIEKASLFCSRGHMQIEGDLIKIGNEQMYFRIEE